MSTDLGETVAGKRRRQAGVVSVSVAGGGGVVGRVTVARSVWSRFLGLMGRPQLAADEGLWLVPCRSIHMFFMRSQIDLAFLDKQGVVVRQVARMRPWSLRPLGVTLLPVRGAHSALELAPDTLRRLQIEPGTRLDFSASGTTDPHTSGRRTSSRTAAARAGE